MQIELSVQEIEDIKMLTNAALLRMGRRKDAYYVRMNNILISLKQNEPEITDGTKTNLNIDEIEELMENDELDEYKRQKFNSRESNRNY